jgi:MEMO1 family protein
MHKLPIIILLLAASAGISTAQEIRTPVWAGRFYPADGDQLSAWLDSRLNVKSESFPGKKPAVLIAPHAGYIYSGETAAAAYRDVKGLDYDTVVVIGPSHHHGFRGGSIYMRGGYRTPLGVLPVDETLAEKLSKWTHFKYIPDAHAEEHAIEVQAPFIQKALPQASICPVVLGAAGRKDISRLAAALRKAAAEKNILVIASTDMSHFLPQKEARKRDARTIKLIQTWKISKLISQLENRENIMCGGTGVAAALEYAQDLPGRLIRILKYDDSTAGGGPESRVVGYLAAAVYSDSAGESGLAEQDRQLLFSIARKAMNRYIKEKKIVYPMCDRARLQRAQGAFVTLNKNGRLRGCIGSVEGTRPLYLTVAEAAVLAAVRDKRFPPVTPDELKDIVLEISILTSPVKITEPECIEVGRHGLIIIKDNKKGLLLPQVAVDNKWSREMFLAQTCEKAGLNRSAWKNGAGIYIFEALVFREEE